MINASTAEIYVCLPHNFVHACFCKLSTYTCACSRLVKHQLDQSTLLAISLHATQQAMCRLSSQPQIMHAAWQTYINFIHAVTATCHAYISNAVSHHSFYLLYIHMVPFTAFIHFKQRRAKPTAMSSNRFAKSFL